MLSIIKTLQLALEDAERTIDLLKQENIGLFKLGQEQLKETALAYKTLAAKKYSSDKTLCLLGGEFEAIREQWENNDPSNIPKNNSVVLSNSETKTALTEKRLKLRIEELKDKVNLFSERVAILERHIVDLEKKYLNLGGPRSALQRPYVFDVLIRR